MDCDCGAARSANNIGPSSRTPTSTHAQCGTERSKSYGHLLPLPLKGPVGGVQWSVGWAKGIVSRSPDQRNLCCGAGFQGFARVDVEKGSLTVTLRHILFIKRDPSRSAR